MASIIKDEKLVKIADGVRPDAKKRVLLPKALAQDGVIFHIYSNSAGQIVLDTQVTVPASEAWLFNNPEALALVRQGLEQAAKGKITKIDINTL